jgi:hypothetical protein
MTMTRCTRMAALLLVCSAGTLAAGDAPFQLSAAGQRRAADRQARANMLKNFPELMRKANGPYITAQVTVCQWLLGLKAKDEAAKIVDEIEKLDAQHTALAGLKKSLEGLASDTPLEDAAKKDLAGRVRTAKKARAGGLVDAAKSLYAGGLPRQAYELLLQAVEFDPDHAAAHQALGQSKAGEAWVDAFSASQIQKGMTYLSDYGWVPTQAVDRTKKDEWFDNGRWMPLNDADTAHSTAATAWLIETPHFSIKSTGPRKRAVALGERLENFYQVVYHEYLEFFLRGEKKPQMSFTHAPAKKMVFYQFADKKDYENAIKNDIKIPALKPFIGFLSLLPGVYLQMSHASYFQLGDDNIFQQIFTTNMVSRQILCEYTQGGSPEPKPWLLGGAAEMLQVAKAGDDGKWYVPISHAHQAVIAATELLNNGELLPIPILLSMEKNAYDKEPGNKANNATAGALSRFLIDTKDGVYALDYLEFVNDTLKNPKATAPLSDYLGMDFPDLDKAFREFLARK